MTETTKLPAFTVENGMGMPLMVSDDPRVVANYLNNDIKFDLYVVALVRVANLMMSADDWMFIYRKFEPHLKDEQSVPQEVE